MRRIPSSENYEPGATIDVTVNLSFVGLDNITTLGFEETLPAGWQFVEVLAGESPPPVTPAPGETGPLAFAWISPPELPVAVTYRLEVPADASGDQEIRGVAKYRTQDEELESNHEVTTLAEPEVLEGEGEGATEGEPEGAAEGESDETITVERTILTGNGYTPGDIIDVRLTVTQNEAVTLLAFGLEEVLPEGFAYETSLDSTPPPIRPAQGDRGAINFAYIIPPGLPVNINYRLRADADATGLKTIVGKAQYRLSGPPLESPAVSTDLPELAPSDLIVCDIEMPATIYSGRTFPFVATLLNQGQSGISPTWEDCVYLSSDAQFGDDTQLFCFSNESRLPPASQYYQQQRIDTPAVAPGNYFVFVAADDANVVGESDESNNLSQPLPVTIQSVDYDVVASHRIVVTEDGTGQILLRGSASNFLFGSPAQGQPVLVDLTLRGVTRTFSAVTDSIGRFEFPFTPLPTEAGRYSISGRHPGEPVAPEQDSLTLNLMRIAYDGAIVNLAPNLSQTVRASVENLGETQLTSVVASVLDVPEGITAQASIASTIDGGTSTPLTITLTVADAEGASGVMRVVVANAQNVNSTFFLPFQVLDGVPNFIVVPTQPIAGAVPGQQTLYVFEVQNVGGGTATNFSVLPPEVPWVSVVAPAVPFNLRAQQTARVILQLTPPSGQAEGAVDAPLLLSFGEDALVPIDLSVNVSTSTTGGLNVTVSDETTLTTDPAFRVGGAQVLLRDPATGAIVSERTSTGTGEVQFRNIPEGAYNIEARRQGYGTFRNVVVIDPASINSYTIVLRKNFTQQRWLVQPTAADNAPAFVSQTIVESGAPGPQITVEPAVIDLETMFEAETTVTLTIRNEGSEPARNVRLTVANQANFIFTPLVTSLGDMAAGEEFAVPVRVTRIAPEAGANVDCVIAGASGVSFVWLQGNTPVLRAFPLAIRLPRLDCPDSRPAYGYLTIERDGATPYTPRPEFRQEAAATVSGKALNPPAPRNQNNDEKSILGNLLDTLAGWLPSLALVTRMDQPEPLSLSAVSPAQVDNGLAQLLRWEGFNPSQFDAAIAPGENAETFLEASIQANTGRTRVGQPFDVLLTATALGGQTLSNVRLELRFFDENQLNETPGFQLTETRLTSINNVTGTGVLSPGVTANARLRYVPLFRAARTRSKLYRVEPKLTFTRNGVPGTMNLLPFSLLVDIQQQSALRLYTPAEVYGNDPLTPEIEPPQPFEVAVEVLNQSTDALRDVRLNRFEPLIEEIDTGEINRFQATRLTDTQSNSRPGLSATLGPIPVSQRSNAVLELAPRSSGFINALSTLLSQELPGLGRVSLLPDTIEQRTLVRAVILNIGSDDGRPDLLIDTSTPPDGIPDSAVMSNTNPVAVQSGSNVQVTPSTTIENAFDVTANMPFFVGYLRIPLPLEADPNLDRVLKSNNTPLPAQNAWTTNRVVRLEGGGVERQLFVNLVDISSNGRYTVIMGAGLIPNEPPVADAGGDQSVFSGVSVTLEGRASFDPEGKDLSYLWEITERPSGSTAQLTNANSPTPTLNPDRRGTYRIRLTVSDGDKTSSDTTNVIVSNRGPTAATSGDLQAPTGSQVTLNATASTDPENDPLTFAWTILSQPAGSNVTLSAADTATPTLTVLAAGNYVFRVTVRDPSGAQSTAEQRLTVINQPPLANAGPDQTARVGDRIDLDGSNSLDPDGSPLTYSWTFVSIPAGSRAIIQSPTRDRSFFTVDRQGDYVVRLTVSDGLSSAVDEVNITTSNRAPIAEPGEPQSAQVGQRVTLDGTQSFDPDGDNLRFIWTLTERPTGSTASLDNAGSPTPSFLLDVAGNYTARLVVTDGSLSSNPATTTVSTDNTPPVANAGPDQSAGVGNTITLDGSASRDADGDQLLYIWSFRARPNGSAAALNNPNAVNPRFTVDLAGTYTLELRVFDGRATSAPDTVTISTQNSAPTAQAGPDRSARVGQTITLDGAASTDPDGDTLTYSWTMTSRPTGSAAALSGADTRTPSLTIDEQGQYVIRLIVNDGKVSSAPDTVIINTQNTPPVANAGPDQSARVGGRVLLDGSASIDDDGDPLTFQWRFTTVPEGSRTGIANSSTATPEFVVDEPGTYVVSLVVNDGTVESAPDTVLISTENTAPVANAGPDRSATVGQTIALDGSASSDADGDALIFAWSVVSRPQGSSAALQNATQPQAAITIDEPGEYIVQLIVNDGTASSAPDTVRISTLNAAPTANAGNDTGALIGQTVTLDGSASSDPDGDALTYRWTLTARPAGSVAALQNATTPSPSFTVDKPGDYTAQLIVNDGSLDSAPDTVRISTQNTAPVARATAPAQATTGAAITLDGSTSSDPDGDTLTFQWSFTSRPAGSAAALSSATINRPSFTPDRPGAYIVRLVVNDGSLNSAPVSLTITAVDPDVEEPCQAPAVPAGITASDGLFPDRVEVRWNTVADAVAYRVWRGTNEDVTAATPLTGWITATTFNDTTADAPVAPAASGCQCQAAAPEFQFYFYWVQARTDNDPECESELGGGDRGHRGSDSKSLGLDRIVRVRALPGGVVDGATRSAFANSPLYLRVTAPWGEVASVWGVIESSQGRSEEISWLPVPGSEQYDGWVKYQPKVPWTPGEIVTFTAGGETATGAVLGPYSMDFLILDGNESGDPELTPVATDSDTGYQLSPAQVYEYPREIAVPLPHGLSPDEATLYYHYDDGSGGLWYPASNVMGFLEDTPRLAEIDGAAYLVARVNHGGVLRVDQNLSLATAPAAATPIAGSWGSILAGAALMALLVASRNWKPRAKN